MTKRRRSSTNGSRHEDRVSEGEDTEARASRANTSKTKEDTSIDGVIGNNSKRLKISETQDTELNKGLNSINIGTTRHTEDSSEDLVQEICTQQNRDEEVQTVRKHWTSSSKNPKTSARFSRWSEGSNNILLFDNAIYVPDFNGLRTGIIRRHHDDMIVGHLGVTRTMNLIKRVFMWPSIRKDVKTYCQTWHSCQQNKTLRHKPWGQFKPLLIAKRIWGSITMDFITALPSSLDTWNTSFDSIMVIVDKLSKMAHYVPCRKTMKASDLASIFLDRIVRYHGISDDIITDRGSLFTSGFWTSLCHHLVIKRKLSTAFHPSTDGQTERQKQTLEADLRAFCNSTQDDWVKLLATAEFAYNNSKHTATSHTPFFIITGRYPKMEFAIEKHEKESQSATEHAEHLSNLREELKYRRAEANVQYSTHYNKKRLPKSYNVGEMVWLNEKNIKTKKPSKKLEARRYGPYEIVEKIGRQAYRLDLPSRSRIHPVFNVNLIESFHPREGEENRPPATELLVEDAGNESWEVDGILDSRRTTNGRVEYLVKWTEFGIEDCTWGPLDNLTTCQATVRAFHKKNPDKPNGATIRKERNTRKEAGEKKTAHIREEIEG